MTITSVLLPADSQPDSNALASLRDGCVEARGFTGSAIAAQRLDTELAVYQLQGLVGPLLELARIRGTIQEDGTILRANGAAAGSFVLYLLGLAAQTRCTAHCYATAYDCYEAAYLKATYPNEFSAAMTE